MYILIDTFSGCRQISAHAIVSSFLEEHRVSYAGQSACVIQENSTECQCEQSPVADYPHLVNVETTARH